MDWMWWINKLIAGLTELDYFLWGYIKDVYVSFVKLHL